MKRFSTAEATRCETATTGRCRCRCRGAFHGARRRVAELPEDDPHLPTWVQLALDLGAAS